jgi:hydroxyethylthiazole kinase
MKSEFAAKAAEILAKVREKKPLVHNITNYVAMNSTANILLAAGAAPVMAHSPREVEEMVGIAGALVLNIGTLSDSWNDSMQLAGKAANRKGIPVILDPVGVGATVYRSQTAAMLVETTKFAVIRGNASEVRALAGEAAGARGVDSVDGVEAAAAAAGALARKTGSIVAVTGPEDIVIGGDTVLAVKNGHPLLSSVTTTGCAATVLIGAFTAVETNTVTAAAAALAVFGLAAEQAAEAAQGPGTFWTRLLDALYHLTPEAAQSGCRIEEKG